MRGFALLAALLIALVGTGSAKRSQVLSNGIDGPAGENGVKIDLEHLLRQASTMHNSEQDIEEDPDDRFITKRGGALRNLSLDHKGPTEWAEELGTAPAGLLSRHKRCNDDDDDGDANRARRARRRRIKRVKVEGLGTTKRKIKKGAAKTTTVTVIQNGQVVSQTIQKPVVHKTTTTTTTTTHHQVQPQIPTVVSAVHSVAPVVQQAAPVVHQAAPTVVVQPPTIG